MKKIKDTNYNLNGLGQSNIITLIDYLMNKYPKYKYSLEFFISDDILRIKVYDRETKVHIVEVDK